MKVEELMTENIEMIEADATIAQAAKKMQSFNIGVLPVYEKPNKVIGMLTDRDIVLRTIAQGREPQETKVREIMTPRAVGCPYNASLQEAIRIMEEKQIHRLLVCDEENQPVGILSLADIAVKSHNEHLTWEVLEKVSEPAHPLR